MPGVLRVWSGVQCVGGLLLGASEVQYRVTYRDAACVPTKHGNPTGHCLCLGVKQVAQGYKFLTL